MTVSLKKCGPINSLEDRPNHTVPPGTLTAFSSMHGFSLAQYTQLCQLIVLLSLNVTYTDKTIKPSKSSLSLYCSEITLKIVVAYLGHSYLVHQQFLECKSSIFFITISWELCLTDFFGDCAETCTIRSQSEISTLIISRTFLSYALTFQISDTFPFNLRSDSCYCYPC